MLKTNKFKINLKKITGRNIHGRICVFHRGGGVKHLYIKLDFYKRINCFGVICDLIKTKYHTSNVGRILYENGLMSYSLMAEELNKGDVIFSGTFIPNDIAANIFKGSNVPIKNLTLFNQISNIELIPFGGTKLIRAAGTSALYIELNDKQATLKLNSGWIIKINKDCLATLGRNSNSEHRFKVVEKAGIMRKRGWRPTVRGVAKNPCDHPHGGGEGKASPPVAAVSPWGRLTKGTPTKNKKKDRKHRNLYKNTYKNVAQ